MDAYLKAQHTALSLLARRRHSKEEVRRKLAARSIEPRIVERVLSECERLKYIDDETAADFFVVELVRKQYGLLRIKDAMKVRGFDPELIDRMIEAHQLLEGEAKLAVAATRKKKSTWLREGDDRKRKEKMVRFLRSRGFRPSTISSVLEEIENTYIESPADTGDGSIIPARQAAVPGCPFRRRKALPPGPPDTHTTSR